MTMLEKVARALCEAGGGKWDAAHFNETLNGEDPEEQRGYYMMQARAAIEAMRKPTEAMVDSTGNGECAKWAPGAWELYIDAALAEVPS